MAIDHANARSKTIIFVYDYDTGKLIYYSRRPNTFEQVLCGSRRRRLSALCIVSIAGGNQPYYVAPHFQAKLPPLYRFRLK